MGNAAADLSLCMHAHRCVVRVFLASRCFSPASGLIWKNKRHPPPENFPVSGGILADLRQRVCQFARLAGREQFAHFHLSPSFPYERRSFKCEHLCSSPLENLSDKILMRQRGLKRSEHSCASSHIHVYTGCIPDLRL